MSFANKPIQNTIAEEIPATQESNINDENDTDYTPVLYDNNPSDNSEYQMLTIFYIGNQIRWYS